MISALKPGPYMLQSVPHDGNLCASLLLTFLGVAHYRSSSGRSRRSWDWRRMTNLSSFRSAIRITRTLSISRPSASTSGRQHVRLTFAGLVCGHFKHRNPAVVETSWDLEDESHKSLYAARIPEA